MINEKNDDDVDNANDNFTIILFILLMIFSYN